MRYLRRMENQMKWAGQCERQPFCSACRSAWCWCIFVSLHLWRLDPLHLYLFVILCRSQRTKLTASGQKLTGQTISGILQFAFNSADYMRWSTFGLGFCGLGVCQLPKYFALDCQTPRIASPTIAQKTNFVICTET